MNLEQALELCARRMIAPAQLVAALREQQKKRTRLGKLAVENGVLSIQQLLAVLDRQMVDPRSIGEIAVEMGYMTREHLARLLLLQSELDDPLPRILEQNGVITEVDFANFVIGLRHEVRDASAASDSLGSVGS